MTPDKVKRKLTAILSADVKGYSRLMGEDEEGTIRTLKVYLEVISGFIAQHQGRVVGTGGDSILAEFPSVVDAVRCSVEIQKELQERNMALAEDRRLEFRIGVNLGDVVEEGDTILGDGVNIAARVQSLAEAGGICITGTVYDHIKNKLAFGYAYVGEQTVKNIKDPVRVYRVSMDPGINVPEGTTEKRAKLRPWPIAAIGLVIVVIAAIGIWKFYIPSAPQPAVTSKEKITAVPLEKAPAIVPPSTEVAPKEKATPPLPEKVTNPAPPPAPKMEVASKEKMAFPLPDQPSIAVLPFVNMSGDPKQEFLCDGITEEIITALSKVARLFVISRQSTFSYKGKPVKVKQVSEELGVRYVLEGSLQRSGDRVRITAQLIDALTGRHLWAERYERDLKDIFALQDEITMKIVTAMRLKLTDGEQALIGERLRAKPRLECYLKVLEGFKEYEGYNIESTRMARRIAEETIAICPEYPYAYLLMGLVHQLEYFLSIAKSPQESIEKGIEMAQKALALDDSIPLGYNLLGAFYIHKKEYDKAIAEGERAVALDPGGAMAHEAYAASLYPAGQTEKAIPIFQKAIRLNPFGPTSLYTHFGNALRIAGRFEESVSAYKKAIQRSPNNIFAHINLAVTYSMMGREKEAQAEAEEVLKINPKFSLEGFAKRILLKDQDQKDRMVEALRKAGLK